MSSERRSSFFEWRRAASAALSTSRGCPGMSDNTPDGAARSLPIKAIIGPLAHTSNLAETLDLPAVVDERLLADASGAYSLNTMRAYRADWKDWAAWCERAGGKAMPADPKALRDYLEDLARGKKVGTLRRRIAAIARDHEIAGTAFDRKHPAIVLAMKRLAREHGTEQEGRAELM